MNVSFLSCPKNKNCSYCSSRKNVIGQYNLITRYFKNNQKQIYININLAPSIQQQINTVKYHDYWLNFLARSYNMFFNQFTLKFPELRIHSHKAATTITIILYKLICAHHENSIACHIHAYYRKQSQRKQALRRQKAFYHVWKLNYKISCQTLHNQNLYDLMVGNNQDNLRRTRYMNFIRKQRQKKLFLASSCLSSDATRRRLMQDGNNSY